MAARELDLKEAWVGSSANRLELAGAVVYREFSAVKAIPKVEVPRERPQRLFTMLLLTLLRTCIATARRFAALPGLRHALFSRFALLVSAALVFIALGSCASARVFRLNPGEEPERYRVVCRDASRMCERRAKEVCEGEYTVLRKEMSEPEIEEVDQSNLSSSGPSEGLVGWRGEMVVACGHELPPIKLSRSEATTTSAPAVAAPASASAPQPAPVRVCVPGATQACLGPGACSGAQACLRDASGYGPCDCGTLPVSAVPSPTAAPTASSSPLVPSPAAASRATSAAPAATSR